MGGCDTTFWRTCFYAVPNGSFCSAARHHRSRVSNQWHLTARVDGCSATRFLAIIQVGDEAVSIVNRDGDTFNVGDWTIKAVLDASKAPELTVSHRTEQAVFSYGTDNPALNGNFYSRQYTGSSLLYDEIDGAYQVVEMTDRSPISTRVVNQ